MTPAVGTAWVPRQYRLVDADTVAFTATAVAATRNEPSWCDDCMPAVDSLAVHSGLVGTVTDVVDGMRVTVEVRVERNDYNGQPGRAFVALREIEGDRVEFGPTAALRMAVLYSEAARLAALDQAVGGAL